MKEEDEQTYTDVIEVWSKIYKKMIGDLFTLEELKQEAWLALLNAEEHAEKNAVDKIPFLASCVKHSLLKLLLTEIEHRATHVGSPQKIDMTTPEEMHSCNEIYKKLKINIKKIPDAEFILPYLNVKTVREISEIAKSEGRAMSKSYVHKVISSIREEFNKLMGE